VELLGLFAIALALSLDAFSVAVVTGLVLNPLTGRHVFRLSFHFGLFQAVMPVIGWIAGVSLYRLIAPLDHWTAFALLAVVGGRMVYGAISCKEKTNDDEADPTSGWSLVILSVSTSIDALAVGLSLALIGSTIVFPALLIGVVAAALTAAGMLLGRRIGTLCGKGVEIFGGIVLIGIGVKILVEHVLPR
jgi:putative Mn2+ efflux pump MntP